jgi:hypothetical protein
MKLTFLLGHFDWNMWVEAGEYYWGYPQTKTNIRLYCIVVSNIFLYVVNVLLASMVVDRDRDYRVFQNKMFNDL